jgi:hypothetical protein
MQNTRLPDAAAAAADGDAILINAEVQGIPCSCYVLVEIPFIGYI